MRVALAIVIPIGAALLQSALVPLIAVGELRPSLVILVAASWAVATGATEATWWAFVGGLATDLLSGGALGALAAAALPAVAAVGLGERPLARQTPVIAGALLVALAALVAGLLYVALLALVGQPLPDALALFGVSAGSAAYTGVLALAWYPFARWLRRVTEQDSPF